MTHASIKATFPWLLFTLVILGLDFLSKWWVMHSLSLYQSIPLFPHFSITYVHNTGAAFSILSGQRWLLALLSIVVSIAILIMIYRNVKHQRSRDNWGLSLVLGGALGNLIDRLYHGYVIDFFDFYIGHWHYPIFNIADCAICIGFALLLWQHLRHSKSKTAITSNKKSSSEDPS